MDNFSSNETGTRDRGRLLSIGYQLRSLDEFVGRLSVSDVDVVLDVRQTAWSHKRGFSKKALEEALSAASIAYTHAKFAGNPKELRRNADSYADCLAAFEQYIEDRPEIIAELCSVLDPLLDQGRNVCLMCYERHPADCHRLILIERWLDRRNERVPIVHIDPEGSPRFTDFQIDPSGSSSQ